MSWLPRISMGLTIAQLSERLRCAECGGPLQSVKPWRQADVLGKPQGRRGNFGNPQTCLGVDSALLGACSPQRQGKLGIL